MANKRFLAGILAIMLVFGITSIGFADTLSASLTGKWVWNTSTVEFFEDGTGTGLRGAMIMMSMSFPGK